MRCLIQIGINDYPATGSDLFGCTTDVNGREKLEVRAFQPTSLHNVGVSKPNILKHFRRGTALHISENNTVLTYLGHGAQEQDEDSDGADDRDEALCLHDTNQGNIFTDDELYDIFCDRKRGTRIILISDSYHSGTVAGARTMMPGVEHDPWDFQQLRYLAPELYISDNKTRMRRALQVENVRANGKIRAVAVLLSGCKDEEYSYDAWFNGRPNGAFTYAALQTLKDLPDTASYRDWHREIRKLLPHVSYPQAPQLSGSWRQRSKWRALEE